ncbi:MAG: DUF4293 domain-containing protein [Balneolaceae bacterium]|nr:DUF4293 domain-containing protein [Balneolaceae bacterium]
MIQRIQSVYLLLITLLNISVFFTPIYRQAMNDPAEWIGLGFAISLTLSFLLSGIAIFLYKNRKRQLQVVKAGTYLQIVSAGFSVGILFSLGGFGTFLWQEVLSTGLVVLALLFYWLAGSAIKKDEELVKSMDRIR